MSKVESLQAPRFRASGGNAVVLMALILVALSGLMNIPGAASLNADTAWLIEVVEQAFAGKVLYRDVIETNPPMSVLLYMPPVAMARMVGMPSETAVAIYAFASAAAIAGLSAGLLGASGWYRRDQLALMALGLFVLMALMPKFVATQREHFGAMAAVPFVLLTALRAGGAPAPGRAIRYAAAACGALCMCIKPHFAFALALPVLWSAVSARSVRPLFQEENWVAGALAAAFWCAAILAFPHYFSDVLPVVLDVYVAQKIPFADYVVSQFSLLFYAFVIVAAPALLHPFARGPAAAAFLSAIGFFLAFLLQGKGWSYHLYPAIQMLGVAALLAQFPRVGAAAETAPRRILRLSAFALIAAAQAGLFVKVQIGENRLGPLLAEVQRPASVLIVTEHHELIFPAVRKAGLTWASRTNGVWLAENAIRQMNARGAAAPERQARLEAAVATMREWLREDMAAMRPEIVVFHRSRLMDWERFALDDPAFAAFMQEYRLVDSFTEAGVHPLRVYRRAVAGG